MPTVELQLGNYSEDLRGALMRAQLSADRQGHAFVMLAHALVALLEPAAMAPSFGDAVGELLTDERQRLGRLHRGAAGQAELDVALHDALRASEIEARASESRTVEAVHFLRVLVKAGRGPGSLLIMFEQLGASGGLPRPAPSAGDLDLRMSQLAKRLRRVSSDNARYVEEQAGELIRAIDRWLQRMVSIPGLRIDTSEGAHCEITRTGRLGRVDVSFDAADQTVVIVSPASTRRLAWDMPTGVFRDDAGDAVAALEQALETLYPELRDDASGSNPDPRSEH